MIADTRVKATARRGRGESTIVIGVLLLQSVVGVVVSSFDRLSPHVQAYIDPGSGALIVQVVVSLVTGVLLSLKRVRETVRRALGRPNQE